MMSHLTRKAARCMGARNTEEKLAWALQAMRGDFMEDGKNVKEAALAYKEVVDCIDGERVIRPEQLHQLVSALAAKFAEERLQQINNEAASGSRDSMSAGSARKKIRNPVASFSASKKKATLNHFVSGRGVPFETEQNEANAINRHWEPTFTQGDVDEEALKACLPFVQLAPDVCSKCTREQVDDLLDSTRFSSWS